MDTQSKTEPFDEQLTGPIKEPEYEVERLKYDVFYRNVLAGEFTRHMRTLKDPSSRVDYFRRMAKAMNMSLVVNQNYLLAQQHDEPYNHETLLDEEGSGLIRQQWLCMFIHPTRERSLFNEAYFFDNYPDFVNENDGIPVRSFNEWKLNFQEKTRTREYVRLQIEDISDRIEIAQQVVNTLILESYFPPMSHPSVLEMGKKADKRIERELMGIESVDWGIFDNNKQLMALAKLWDLVAFKIFLQKVDIESGSTSESKEDQTGKDVKAIALMYMYLDKIGYFPEGVSLRKQLIEQVAPKHTGISPESLYNKFMGYRKDRSWLKKNAVHDIQKAIILLKQRDWQTAVTYAEADLLWCKSREEDRTS